jgi:lantibiotic modifying enzyme
LKAARELIPIAPEDHDWQTIEANWNNGAAGLGLSWIHNAWAMNDDRYDRNIDQAVNRCVEASLDAPDQVCHGIGGRLDLLIEASKFLGDSDHLLEVARKHAGWCIGRAKRAGGFRLHSQLPAGATLHGFYEGSSGIGYQLLRLASPGSLPSVLLWN